MNTEINKDDAGIFMLRTKDVNLIGFSLDLKLKIQRLTENYDLQAVKILLKCHRNKKGIDGTKPFLENETATLLQKHNAKPFDVTLLKTKSVKIKVVQVKTISKVIKEPKKPKEPKTKKERKQRIYKRKDSNIPHGSIGKVRSEITRARIGKSKLGNKNCLGRVLSEQTKALISNSNKGKNKGKGLGKTLSDAHKEKIRLAKKATKISKIIAMLIQNLLKN
jgi:hypothetical protein